MKTPQDWMTGRENDFTPEEMATCLAWISDVQRDAIGSCLIVCETAMDAARSKGLFYGFAQDCRDGIRNLLPEAP